MPEPANEDVGQSSQSANKMMMLEHHACCSPMPAQCHASGLDVAVSRRHDLPVSWPDQTVEAPQQCGLSRTGRTEKNSELALPKR
jgi:hypothetical protein